MTTDLQSRAQAIDVMRGLTLTLMIIVNMSISESLSYAPLLHATWNGLTLTDLVFPNFLFVVGCTLSYTLEKYQSMGNAAVLKKVFSRTALIFLCGYLMYWFPFFEFDHAGHVGLISIANTRILGVLQRIALAYGFATLIIHFWKLKGAVIFCVIALLIYWWIMDSFGDYTMTGNAALKLDKLILGDAHMYHGEGIAFDPEGLLGTLPAIVNVLAGYFAGHFVRLKGKSYETISKLLIWSGICIVVALSWSSVFPLNKKLWTSSYVMCNVGIDLFVLALLIYVIDLLGFKKWTYFFEVFGKNTLFIYLVSEIAGTILWTSHIGKSTGFEWIYYSFFEWWAGDKNGSLLFALIFMLTCWAIGYAMDKKKIYIKL